MPTTQVVDQSSNQVFTAAAINEAAQVADFQDKLSQARNTEVSLNATTTNLINDVQALFDSRANFIQSFKVDALGMFPDLAGQDMDKIMSQLPTNHPLGDLWDSYQSKIAPLVQSIKLKTAMIEDNLKAIAGAQGIEDGIWSDYIAFCQTATTAVPTPPQMAAKLAQLDVIPTAESTSLVASIPAIELLDASAADMVMAQAVDNQEALSDEQMISQGATPPFVDPSQVAAANSSNIKPIGVAVVLAGLAYAVFGGSKT